MLCGPKATVKKARRLRRTMTAPFFCSEARLAIEIDGISHDMGDEPTRDEARDRWLETRNVATLRIAAADVARSADQAIEWIVATCIDRRNPLHRSSSGPPPRSGEETL